jgi:hypothetical protein
MVRVGGTSSTVCANLKKKSVCLFARHKVPPTFRSERNCQLGMVTCSIVFVLLSSARHAVDWAAHVGGSLQVSQARYATALDADPGVN